MNEKISELSAKIEYQQSKKRVAQNTKFLNSSDNDDIPNLSESSDSEGELLFSEGELFTAYTPSEILDLEMAYQRSKDTVDQTQSF